MYLSLVDKNGNRVENIFKDIGVFSNHQSLPVIGSKIADDDSVLWNVLGVTYKCNKQGYSVCYYTIEKTDETVEKSNIQKVRHLLRNIGNKEIELKGIESKDLYGDDHKIYRLSLVDYTCDGIHEGKKIHVDIVDGYSWIFDKFPEDWQDEVIDRILKGEYTIVKKS